MRRANKVVALGFLCAALLALIAMPSAQAKTPAPTRAQITAAVRAATRSPLLWATINACGVNGSASAGIRGEMPALPFPAHLLMVVTVQEWSPTAHRYLDVDHTWKLGGDVFDDGSVVQNGIRLKWSGQVTLIAHIDFEWFRDGKLIGSTSRATTGGHAKADGSGYSVGTCSTT